MTKPKGKTTPAQRQKAKGFGEKKRKKKKVLSAISGRANKFESRSSRNANFAGYGAIATSRINETNSPWTPFNQAPQPSIMVTYLATPQPLQNTWHSTMAALSLLVRPQQQGQNITQTHDQDVYPCEWQLHNNNNTQLQSQFQQPIFTPWDQDQTWASNGMTFGGTAAELTSHISSNQHQRRDSEVWKPQRTTNQLQKARNQVREKKTLQHVNDHAHKLRQSKRRKFQDRAIYSRAFTNQVDNLLSYICVPQRNVHCCGLDHFQLNINPQRQEDENYFALFHNIIKKKHFTDEVNTLYSQFLDIPINKQVESLAAVQTLTQEDLRIRWQMTFDVLYLLRWYYPKCEVYGIRSLLTHFKIDLSELNSGVQLYVDLNGNGVGYEDNAALHNMVHQVKSILGSELCPHTGTRLVSQFIKDNKSNEIIRFVHGGSRLECELYFQSHLPVQRSELIRHSMRYDPRMKQFIGVLQYWSRFYGVCDDQDNQKKLPEFALFLMALVYVTEDRKILPPVCSFQDKLKVPFKFAVTDSDIPTDQVETTENIGTDTIEMLKEFCRKYADLDFTSVMISPYCGQIIPREYFESENCGKLPDSLIEFSEQMNHFWDELDLCEPMCIQDPFELRKNVLRQESRTNAIDIMELFKNACRKTLDVFQENGENQKSIMDLFLVKTVQEASFSTSEIPVPLNEDLPSNFDHNTPPIYLQFTMDNVFAGLYMDRLKASSILLEALSNMEKMGMIRTNLQSLWSKFAYNFIQDIFEQGLQLPTDDDVPICSQVHPNNKEEAGAPVDDKVVKRFRVTYPFWKERNSQDEAIDCEKNPIESEAVKSIQILMRFREEQRAGLATFEDFFIHVECQGELNKNGIQEIKYILKVQTQNDGGTGADENNQHSCDALESVSKVFERNFPVYQKYRLNSQYVSM